MGTLLGRDLYFKQGHKNVYANQYILLQGLPATRKSTAMGIGTKLLKAAGYKRFSPERMSRQAFINELHAMNQPEAMGLDLMDMLDMPMEWDYEMCIHATEFVDFVGQHDKDYLMLLTRLWDNEDEYSNPKISKSSIKVKNPTINMLAANTPANLNLAFPAGSMDSGTFSRIIFVHGADTGKRILVPSGPGPGSEQAMVNRLVEIKKQMKGPVTMTPNAREALEYIYRHAEGIQDPRFSYYNGRRLTHLLKLILVVLAMRLSTEVTDQDVLQANTILGMTEYGMPQALGHFGRSHQSITLNNLIEWLRSVGRPITLAEIYKAFAADFNSERDFQSSIQDLQNSGRLIPVSQGDKFLGFTIMDDAFPKWMLPLMLPDLLTKQERAFIGM